MELQFSGEIFFWRGPAPWYFVMVPEDESFDLEAVSSQVSYGWGMIPVRVTIGATAFETALWPKDGQYIVPLKSAVRAREHLELGDTIEVHLTTPP